MSRGRRALLALLLVAGLLVHGATHAWAEVAGPRVSHTDLEAPGPPDSSVALPCSRPPDVARPGRALGDAPRGFALRVGSLADAAESTGRLALGHAPRARSNLLRFTRASLGAARGDPDDPPH